MAEAFLVQDTGTKDAARKAVVHVFGGLKWGWQVKLLQDWNAGQRSGPQLTH
jgi:hypothetical protein